MPIKTWNGNQSGNIEDYYWLNANNWLPQELPAADDAIVINSGGSAILQVGGSSVASVSIAGELQVEESTLTVASSLINSNWLFIDNNWGAGGYGGDIGGSVVTIGGALSNSGWMTLGSDFATLTGNTIVSAAALDNSGVLELLGSTSPKALSGVTLDVHSTAGFGADGVLSGTVNIINNAAVVFDSGQIASIDSGGRLFLNGPNAFVADAGVAGNSALAGLAYIGGGLILKDAALTTSDGLTNAANLTIDQSNYDGVHTGGSSIVVGGALTNSGFVNIGSSSLTNATSITTSGLENTGYIYLDGNAASGGASATLTISTGNPAFANDSGFITLNAGAELHLAGSAHLAVSATPTGAFHPITGAGAVTLDPNAELLLQGYGAAGPSNAPGVEVSYIVDNGTIDGEGGYVVVGAAGGTISGTGTLFAGAGATFEIASAVANETQVQFALGPSAHETVQIDDLASDVSGVQRQDFNATIHGFASGDVLAFAPSSTGAFGLYSDINSLSVTVIYGPDPSSDLDDTTAVSLIYIDGAGAAHTVSTVNLAGNYGGALFALTKDANGAVQLTTDAACFMPGTRVRTPTGEVAVEVLNVGDLVLTVDGRALPVSWLGRQTVSMRFAKPLRVAPIRIRAGALGEGVPSNDLLLSPDHALLIEDILVQAGALVNGTSIVRETDVPERFTYFHVEVEEHALIFAENTPAETFVDNIDRMAFDNWEEHVALYPAGRPIDEMPHPRAKACRQVPRQLREALAARGESLCGPVREPARFAA